MSQIDKAAAKEIVGAGAGMGAQDQVYIPAPRFIWAIEHLRPAYPYSPEILTLHKDTIPGGNVVVNQGAAMLLNVPFGSGTASTKGAFLQLHSATTASNHVWSNISASQVASYGNNVPQLTFASTYTVRSASATAQYVFTAGTQTVSGACVQFYTTNTQSSNAATVDILHYSEGLFANSRQVIGQAGASDTLNVSVTVTFGT